MTIRRVSIISVSDFVRGQFLEKIEPFTQNVAKKCSFNLIFNSHPLEKISKKSSKRFARERIIHTWQSYNTKNNYNSICHTFENKAHRFHYYHLSHCILFPRIPNYRILCKYINYYYRTDTNSPITEHTSLHTYIYMYCEKYFSPLSAPVSLMGCNKDWNGPN